MRRYVEGRFGFPATDRTIEEIKRDINSVNDLNGDLRNDLVSILSDTELVKFADLNPGSEKSLQILSHSFDFVDKTKPVEEVQDSVL